METTLSVMNNWISRCRRHLATALLFPAASLLLVFGTTCLCAAQQSDRVDIRVQFNGSGTPWRNVWSYFGYDEPNYTYAPNGKKLLGELAALDSSPTYVRVHNLFTSGDGSASLKWGSTNVYTEDASGHPVYNWTILNHIFDTFHQTGVKPLIEIGFMPEALSVHPEPYRHTFPSNSVGGIFTGWAYPPKDYQKWADLVFQFAQHLRQRYGDAEVKTWLWEVWNEPDIGYWQGTRDEFFKLYDYTVESVLRALPEARIGGPDTTGPSNAKAADFLRAFLQHCAHDKNYATGKNAARLDFISFHPKGSPKWLDDHVQMGISRQLGAIQEGFRIVASFPEWQHTPIILGESDPEGCAACSAKQNPQNLYRNGPLYGAYTVEVLNHILELARREHINFMGAVTWAFEFEDQPPFAGFRELATNGIDKPVLNAFRMLDLLGNERVDVSSSGALRSDDVVTSGVRKNPDVSAIATRKEHEVEVLVWNYHDDDISSPTTAIDLEIESLPSEVKHGLLKHYRVDSHHSNAFAVWQSLGSPEALSTGQRDELQKAGQLQLLTAPERVSIKQGILKIEFDLPRQGLSLLSLSW